jgi:hypothetical protein
MKIIKFIFLILIIIFFSCVKKNENTVKEDINDQVLPSNEKIVYIIPYDGLNLRTEPDITSTRVRLLSQNTKLTVLEKSNTQVLIDDILDYWYKLDTGEETGWVFGGYIFNKPVPTGIKNIEITKMLAENAEFFNDWIVSIIGAIEYTNRDTLTVHINNTKESECFLINNERVFLIKIEETPDWFYIISSDCEIQGYINIYDISKKSFYGDIEANQKSGNYYRRLQNIEYDIINQHNNILRYGPLLTINHDGKLHEFWDKRYGLGFTGYNILLLDYYPEYNEILIMKQYYEGTNYFIYNLEFEEYRCENIENPSFNMSRTYLCSPSYLDDLGNIFRYSINLFRIDNGFYQEIFNEGIYVQRNWRLENILWINDHEVHIDYGDAGKIIIKIGDDIQFINNMLPLQLYN